MVCPENGTAVLKGFVTSFVFSRTTSNIFTLTPPSGLYLFEAVVNPFSTGVTFWGQAIQIPYILFPKRDCGSHRVNRNYAHSYIVVVVVLTLTL